MASEGDVRGSGLASEIIGDDLHLAIPDDSNTGVGSSQVDTQSPSSLHLDLDKIGGLVMEVLKYRTEQSDYYDITSLSLQVPEGSQTRKFPKFSGRGIFSSPTMMKLVFSNSATRG